jgi:hypothetical protein
MRKETYHLFTSSKIISQEAYKEAVNLYFAANLMAWLRGAM